MALEFCFSIDKQPDSIRKNEQRQAAHRPWCNADRQDHGASFVAALHRSKRNASRIGTSFSLYADEHSLSDWLNFVFSRFPEVLMAKTSRREFLRQLAFAPEKKGDKAEALVCVFLR